MAKDCSLTVEGLLGYARDLLEGPMCLDKAILVAVIAHAGQTDKGGNSYIRHPLRVMEGLDSEDEMVVGISHDLVEDTDVTPVHLTDLGYTSSQLRSIDALTKREGETYDQSIDRVLKDPVARKVKSKDLRDNMQLWRLKNKKLTPKDMERQQNYIDALVKLGEIDKK